MILQEIQNFRGLLKLRSQGLLDPDEATWWLEIWDQIWEDEVDTEEADAKSDDQVDTFFLC